MTQNRTVGECSRHGLQEPSLQIIIHGNQERGLTNFEQKEGLSGGAVITFFFHSSREGKQTNPRPSSKTDEGGG